MYKLLVYVLLSSIAVILTACSENEPSKKSKKAVRKDNFKKVTIGSQTWMSENMKISNFRNGDIIPKAQSADEWKQAAKNKEPAWCYYENDDKNGAKYGKLYNYYAINDPRGFAPEGWHVPTDSDWKTLEKHLGANAGTKLKSASGWDNEGNGTNESGFSGLPGGYRDNNGSFFFKGQNGYWWISSASKSKKAACCDLNFKYKFLLRLTANKETGFSIRCIKN